MPLSKEQSPVIRSLDMADIDFRPILLLAQPSSETASLDKASKDAIKDIEGQPEPNKD